MKTLAVERLLLRSWAVADVDYVFDLYSRWEVQQFLGAAPRVMTQRSEADQVIEFRGMERPVHGDWAVEGRADDRVDRRRPAQTHFGLRCRLAAVR
jgi:RimJ/RimL family protein N-acetyltransferase